MTHPILRLVLLAALSTSVGGPVQAAWPEYGQPIRTAADESVWGTGRSIVPDGQGGAFVVWRTTANNGTLRAQRIDAEGQSLWTPGGLVVDAGSTATGAYLWQPSCAVDDVGGVLIVWLSDRADPGSSDFDVYAQRLDASGATLWSTPEARLNDDEVELDFDVGPEIVSDGAGGAIVAWTELESGSDRRAQLQRLSPTGAVLGAPGGRPILVTSAATGPLRLAADVANERVYFAAAIEAGGDLDLVAGLHRLNDDISDDLFTEIIGVDGFDETNGEPQPDGTGGFYVTYERENASLDLILYTEAFDASAGLRWSAARRSSTLDEYQFYWTSAADPVTGDLFVQWGDNRAGSGFTGIDLFAQRLRFADGARAWSGRGVPVCEAPNGQAGGQILARPGGGAIVLWHDYRNETPTDRADIWSQAIDADGGILWALDGVRVVGREGFQFTTGPTYVSEGELFFLIRDSYPGTEFTQHRVQRLDLRHGFWGRPEPVMNGLTDVGGDQGGVLEATWWPSDHDILGSSTITHYSVWRATTALPRGGTGRLVESWHIPFGFDGEAFMAAGDWFWEYVGQQAAGALPGYSYTVPTTANSVDTAVQVVAHTSDPLVNFPSVESVAQSTDDLPPAAPLDLDGTRTGSMSIALSWSPSGENEEDFASFVVYRSNGSILDLGTATRVDSTIETALVDGGVVGGATYTYAVVATDVNGNASATSNSVTIVDAVTSVDGASIGGLRLRPNAPNPFGSSTTLRFALPRADLVEIDVFDLAGRRVRSIRREFAAGWHAVPFDARDDDGRELAAGVYLTRVRAGDQTANGRMMIVR